MVRLVMIILVCYGISLGEIFCVPELVFLKESHIPLLGETSRLYVILCFNIVLGRSTRIS